MLLIDEKILNDIIIQETHMGEGTTIKQLIYQYSKTLTPKEIEHIIETLKCVNSEDLELQENNKELIQKLKGGE